MYPYKEIDYQTVEIVCPSCGKAKQINVGPHGIKGLQVGMLVQEALPNVPAPLREMFVSGTCPKCYAAMLGLPVEFGEDDAVDRTVDEVIGANDRTVDGIVCWNEQYVNRKRF